jgi:hypothetical protein
MLLLLVLVVLAQHQVRLVEVEPIHLLVQLLQPAAAAAVSLLGQELAVVQAVAVAAMYQHKLAVLEHQGKEIPVVQAVVGFHMALAAAAALVQLVNLLLQLVITAVLVAQEHHQQ